MLIKMLKGACACNDGVHSTWYNKDQEVISPDDITHENAQIFVDHGIAALLAGEKEPDAKVPLKEDDSEIIDIDEDEEEEVHAPEIIKELTNRPLFSRKKGKR